MKKFSTLVFIHFFMCIFAQQVVNTTTSNNIRITDKVSISMQPGFHVKAGNNTKFRAFIDTRGNGIPDYLEAHLPSHEENYIKTSECLDSACKKKKETVIYFDGLGREKQGLQVAASTTGKNIVTPFEYDEFGRQAKEFLPFPTQSTSNKISKETDGTSFYTNLTGDTTPYSEKTFENSPLNRVVSQAAPGESWKKSSGHEIGFSYESNSASDVLLYNVALSDTYIPSLVHNGTNYPAGTLYKTITTDENGQPIQEFKDKEGRVILKRIEITHKQNAPLNSSGRHDTYYVYDVYGNLTYVLPPKLIEVGINATSLAELGYQYQYDEKNRLVEKQLPGKGREYMVYDKQDRLVAAQDALQRERGGFYTFMQYDKFGRLAVQGQHPEPDVSRETLQNYVNGLGSNNVKRVTSSYHHSGIDIFYTRAYGGDQYVSVVTTVNYYDNYDNLDIETPTITNQKVIGKNDLKTKGLAVSTFSNVLGSANWNKSFTFYDKDYIRPIYYHMENHLKGYSKTVFNYNFRGKVTSKLTKQKGTPLSEEIIINEVFDYYDNELLKLHTHQVNSEPIEYLVQNTYNEINQLISKKVGNDNASTPLQNVDYKYNIRGWMTDINDIDFKGGNTHKDLFSFRINYTNNYFNGNISSISWKTYNDTDEYKTYIYNYDGLNRLLNADFGTVDNITKHENFVSTYNEKIKGYDKNGNILGIERNGNTLNSNIYSIDNLIYDYNSNSNKLLNVTDDKTEDGFNDKNKYRGVNLNDSHNDYAYDVNGNLIKDLNKGITKISYNELNLPTEIFWNTSNKINYIYDSNGIKLKKIVTNETKIVTTDYINGFQYKNNVLQFFPTSEGYVNVSDGVKFNYVYNYKDHLGNVRLSYQKESSGSLKILEENNYYPYGLKHEGYNEGKTGNQNYNYKYNGKEWQGKDDLYINLYDYGARNYDPAIGRWINVDPLAEKMRRHSTYAYAFNNPILFIDPDGMRPEITIYNTGEGIGISFEDGMVTFSAGLTIEKGGPNKEVKFRQKFVPTNLSHTRGIDTIVFEIIVRNSDGYTISHYVETVILNESGQKDLEETKSMIYENGKEISREERPEVFHLKEYIEKISNIKNEHGSIVQIFAMANKNYQNSEKGQREIMFFNTAKTIVSGALGALEFVGPALSYAFDKLVNYENFIYDNSTGFIINDPTEEMKIEYNKIIDPNEHL
ncbi:RHS repeat-associated core domain-containing protein [Chishuiella changwenlii]|uniref:RHS repeat-associated core domain-containing protein n=1 Tax=Chishuiella changwenlii TaxID=1434701 RepID=A0A1M7BSH7_9FLAO|nr:DUF6443 domain-containing protein [Chishuiella changwenlii]SHL57904.1 RHS repeat-associated core domain-containing protein [Chishuiella changwenlii]